MFRRVCIFTLYFALAAFVPSALAQAVYGSISGTVTDPSGGVLPGVTVTVTSVERKTVDAVVTNDSGQYVKDRLLPGAYEVKVELQGFKQMVVSRHPGQRRQPDAARRRAAGRRARRSGDRPGILAAPQDRSRRRRDDVRLEADYRSPGARSQLHQVRAADARHAAARLAARREREPAGIDPDDGERAALQRHRLPARRHGEPRSHPRHHRHQPDARVDRRNQDHVAELRRRVRAGDGGRRLGADEVGRRTSCAAAASGSTRTTTSSRAIRSRSSSAIR